MEELDQQSLDFKLLQQRLNKIVQFIKTKIPFGYFVNYLPLKANVENIEQIMLTIKSNFNDFIIKPKEKTMFISICRVFPYPNNINSIRIVIIYFVK